MPADTYFKVLGVNGEAVNGGTGSWFLPTRKGRPGKWMPKIDDIELCSRGYHIVQGEKNLIPFLSPRVWVVEFNGDEIKTDGAKIVVSRARLVRQTAWDDKVAVTFAANCAEHVLSIYESRFPYDDRPRKAIEAARDFRAAGAAAYAAAGAAAHAAAGAAAGAAAYAAAYAAAGAAAHAAAGAAADAAAYAAADAAAHAAAGATSAARAAAYAAADAAADAAHAAERDWQAAHLSTLLFPTKGSNNAT